MDYFQLAVMPISKVKKNNSGVTLDDVAESIVTSNETESGCDIKTIITIS